MIPLRVGHDRHFLAIHPRIVALVSDEGNDAGLTCGRDLHRGVADRPGGPGNYHPLARLQPAPLDQRRLRREERYAHGCRGFDGEST